MDTQIVLNVGIIIEIAKVITSLGVICALIWNVFRQYTKWESYDTKIKELNDKVDAIKGDMDGKVEELQTDIYAKLQSVQAEQCMQTYVLQAVLSGLKQLNCNGPVTEASDKLSKYINQKAHEVVDDDK